MYHVLLYVPGSVLNVLDTLLLTLTSSHGVAITIAISVLEMTVPRFKDIKFPEAKVPPLIRGEASQGSPHSLYSVFYLKYPPNCFPVFWPIRCIRYLIFWRLSTFQFARAEAILYQEIPIFHILIFFAILQAPPPSHHTLTRTYTTL